MRLVAMTLALACTAFVASAADNPLAGSWKLNAAKSQGPVPPCVQDGILKIRAEIYTGPSQPHAGQEAAPAPESRKCASVYLFTPSPDGRTLTLTRPQGNPADHAVFDKVK